MDSRRAVKSLLFLFLSLLCPLLATATVAASQTGRRPFGDGQVARSPMANKRSAESRFVVPPQRPPVFNATAESILADVEKLKSLVRGVYDKIVAEVHPDHANFGNVMEPMLQSQNLWREGTIPLCLYQHISTNASLREASSKAEKLVAKFHLEMVMRVDVFKLVDAVNSRKSSENLTLEQHRVLEREYLKRVYKGLLLPSDRQRLELEEQENRLTKLRVDAHKNLGGDNKEIWFTREELEGVPAAEIDLGQLQNGTGENEGKFRLTFKHPHSVPLMKYATREDTRRRYSMADANKAIANVPLFREMVVIRDKMARSLGYVNYASLRIESKMAKTTQHVYDFLNDLRKKLAPGSAEEANRLLECKRRDFERRNETFDGTFYVWDIAYYSRIMKEEEYDVSDQEIAEYFPLNSTLTGMLSIFEDLFGLRFVRVEAGDRAVLSPTGKAEDIVWHPDVALYAVWNDEEAGGDFLGYLYMDLHPRPHKYGNNANAGIIPGFSLGEGKTKARNYPVTVLICNFSGPTRSTPALLKHREVVTLFHELGHGITDLVSQTRYSEVHGNRVSEDFLETPSQMLENWCWDQSVLRRLSSHWETKAQIPDAMTERLVKSREFNSVIGHQQQLFLSLFDMAVYTPQSAEELEKMDIPKLWFDLRKGTSSIVEPKEWSNRFGAIGQFFHSYDAGYYGYLYSKVFSADMFDAKFKANPMNRTEGRRYRQIVLERGGSMDEMSILKEFLGREPKSDAFSQLLGISQ
ncbi:metallopeptidase MepB [Drechmeria coniospora]|uniref:Metallopeptidase MepB n=1 Tax=Drechmeria coniospora TaxID=98403 RepID=A0A151GQH2_DRECN|nr:metallopeptidase MepB [Drechmeria coniospora]KYK59242.1 metallopeptidase MepB [Drechmeria coniospora]ODA77984.1 hypothetical protein RJ55_06587 [Drechmeria coniospora]